MDISTSCYSLHADGLSHQPVTQQKSDENGLGSCRSLSRYETRNFKNLLPQIFAAIVVSSLRVSAGIALAYSAILLPQLKDNPEIQLSKTEASWATSIVALTTPAASLFVGVLMDRLGRLHSLATAAVPGVLGCVIIALSNNAAMLITGRALMGLCSGISASPAIVYMTEIARKDMRGSLISFIPTFTSLGMLLTFVLGWFMNWRQVAWCANGLIVVPCIVVFFMPESPAWLVSKGRIEEAKKSLQWINRYQPQPEGQTQSLAEMQLVELQKDHERKMIEMAKRESNDHLRKMREFLKPPGYKPMLILIGVFFFQQYSGIFIFFFHSIAFFQEVGSTVDPYFCSICISGVRLIMSITNTFVLKNFRRRPLVMLSCVGMSCTIIASGLFTSWIKNGTTQMTWVPVVFLILFVVTSMMGLVNIPYSMTAELFPLEIRGVCQSVATCVANVFMFLALQFYPFLKQTFNGMVGLQYFFGTITLLGLIFVYIFLPETHEKKLSEIESYFWENIVFIGQKKRESRKKKVNSIPDRIVKDHQEQEKTLLQRV